MAALTAAILGIALLSNAPAAADPVDRWAVPIADASRRFGVPAPWIRRVMRAESGGRTMHRGRPIVSRAGAMGLMQLMPGTWRDMRASLGLGVDPHHPRDNILAGAAYLGLLHERFGYPGLFAAYHAGPARYARHLATGRPLPPATRDYLSFLLGSNPRRPPPAGRSANLFAVRAPPSPAEALATPQPAAPAALFVRLTTTPRPP